MKETELDDWFFNIGASWQMNITGIYINEDEATDQTYEKFDNAVADWWDNRDYNEKFMIYKNELRSNQ